jgi:biopolymer transport protein ExbD
MEAEKKARTKKTERKKTAKKTTKEGVKEKRTKGSRKKATKKTTTKQVIRVKDVGELVEYCKTLLGRKPFEGAAVDFHQKKPAYVYLPADNSVTKVDTQKLLDFLKEKGVQRVLIDALNKKRLPTLVRLCEAGFEVFVLRRTYAIEQLRQELRRQNVEVPKSDRFDAVLLAFTSPKKWALVDAKFLKAWKAMTEWRYADTTFRIEQQRYNANNSEGPKEDEEDEELRIKELIRVKLEEVQRLLEEVQKLEAQLFVLKVQKQYNVTEEDFQKLGIETDDTVAKAYACEAILEAIHCDTLVGFINKAGIRLSKKGRPFIHDGRLSYVLHQLAIKVYRLDVNNQRGKIRYKKLRLARKILKLSKRIRGSGRVGEALGPDLPKGRVGYLHPALWGGTCEKQE